MAQIKRLSRIVLASLFLVCAVSDGSALSAGNEIGIPSAKLPRTFQSARLGMAHDELAKTVQGGRMDFGFRDHRTVTLRPKDPYLERVQYRFHHGVLREIAISYRPHRVPDGYEGLLRRLKDIYGQPIRENQDEYDVRPDVLAVTKTVWKDGTTKMELTKSRSFHNGEELVLTITDIALQEAYDAERIQEYRQKVLRVPIPLSDAAQYH